MPAKYEPADGPRQPRAMRRILVVEDADEVRHSIRDSLAFHGYMVIEAGDGAEALALLARGNIDAVVTDLWMPAIDGLELLTKLHKFRPELPVVAISGGAPGRAPVDYSVSLARTYGADAVFNKPFDNDDLVETLNALLEQAR